MIISRNWKPDFHRTSFLCSELVQRAIRKIQILSAVVVVVAVAADQILQRQNHL
jgi:hypothetical protein